jgi:hypothetical protein
MGTDYDEFRKPCPCGQGTVRVGRSSPDHGWASAYSVHWDANIECPACQQIYMIDGADAGMRIVRRADVAAFATRRSAYDAACAEFMALPSITLLKSAFAAHLEDMRSVAAVHRFLDANGMAGYAVGAFRKNWRGGRDWADRHIGVWNVAKIAGLLGQDTAVYDAALAQIEGLKAAIGGVPTVIGRIATMEVPPQP